MKIFWDRKRHESICLVTCSMIKLGSFGGFPCPPFPPTYIHSNEKSGNFMQPEVAQLRDILTNPLKGLVQCLVGMN